MSSNIEIIQEGHKGMELVIRAKSIKLMTFEAYEQQAEFIFDMSNESHRQGIKTMIEVLQHQLEIHEGK